MPRLICSGILALAMVVATAEAEDGSFKPSNIVDRFWWKLGLFPKWAGNGTAVFIPTSFGSLQAHTFGDRDNNDRFALALHSGMNINHVHREFDGIGQTLEDNFDYFVVIPNFHSLRSTSPGTITSGQINKLIPEILKWAGAKVFDMLLGKSWGGAMAARFAVAHPSKVLRLTMISPGPLREDVRDNPDFTIRVSAMLLYCVDDTSLDRGVRKKLEKAMTNSSYSYPYYRGGSVIISNFTEDIVRFAKVTPVYNEAEAEDESQAERLEL